MLRFDPTPFNFVSGLLQWLLIFGIFFAITLIVGYIISIATFGIQRGSRAFLMHLGQGFRELVLISPRRVWAIAQLVIRESIRRKALLVIVVFFLLFMFGSWFVTESGERPEMQAAVHITFILKAITWLTLPVVLLLACWGLPQDIKQRSLHTVVTKPVRRSEVVIGRILGFSAIGTLILGVMAVAGHIWIKRQVPPEAQAELVSRVPIYGELSFTDQQGNPGEGVNTGDIWEFRSYIAGGTQASAIWTFDDITPADMVETIDPLTGEPRQEFQLEYNFEAFRTHKGQNPNQGLRAQIHFLNDLRRQMAHVFAGIIEFESVSSQISAGNFQGAGTALRGKSLEIDSRTLVISETMFEELAKRFRILSRLMQPFADQQTFASAGDFAGVASAGLAAAEDKESAELSAQLEKLGTLMEENQDALAEHLVNLRAVSDIFEVIEYKRRTVKRADEIREGETEDVRTTTYGTSRTLTNTSKQTGSGPPKLTLDLFDDLTHGGQLRVAVYCMDHEQFLGMARPDLYVRTPDRVFESGYYKAIGGTWMMLILVIVLGVTASTFVKGPVATLLTITLFVIGMSFHGFLEELVTDIGGKGFGTLESMVRIVEHKNPQVPFEESTPAKVMAVTDKVILGGLWTVYKTVPNFNVYSLGPYVANGFDVPFSAGLLPAFATTIAYLIPCLGIGYFSLRLRELEAK